MQNDFIAGICLISEAQFKSRKAGDNRNYSYVDLSPAFMRSETSHFFTEGGDFCVFNGRLFDSPAETPSHHILNSYRHVGIEVFKSLDGEFCVCLWDSKQQVLIGATDPVRTRPLYYGNFGNHFFIGTTLQLFREEHGDQLAIDISAVRHYMGIGVFPTPETIYTQVSSLPAGCFIIISKDHTDVTRYIDIMTSDSYIQDITEHRDLVEQRLIEAISRRIDEHSSIGLFLSGGVDSSTLAGITVRLVENKKSLQAFTMGVEAPGLNETSYAREVIRHSNIPHHVKTITYQDFIDSLVPFIKTIDQPSFDGMNEFFVAQFARNYVPFALSGSGSNEIFAGYNTFDLLFSNLEPLDIAAAFVNRRFSNASFFTDILTDFNEQRKISENDTELYQIFREMIAGYPSESSIKSIICMEIYYYIQDRSLRDKYSVDRGIAVSFPFTDVGVMKALFSNFEFIIHQKTRKRCLEEIARSYIPMSIINREKRGFELPYYDWLLIRGLPLTRQILTPDSYVANHLVDYTQISKLIELASTNLPLSRLSDLGYKVWILICFELWTSLVHKSDDKFLEILAQLQEKNSANQK